jgi:hypothetical protein
MGVDTAEYYPESIRRIHYFDDEHVVLFLTREDW